MENMLKLFKFKSKAGHICRLGLSAPQLSSSHWRLCKHLSRSTSRTCSTLNSDTRHEKYFLEDNGFRSGNTNRQKHHLSVCVPSPLLSRLSYTTSLQKEATRSFSTTSRCMNEDKNNENIKEDLKAMEFLHKEIKGIKKMYEEKSKESPSRLDKFFLDSFSYIDKYFLDALKDKIKKGEELTFMEKMALKEAKGRMKIDLYRKAQTQESSETKGDQEKSQKEPDSNMSGRSSLIDVIFAAWAGIFLLVYLIMESSKAVEDSRIKFISLTDFLNNLLAMGQVEKIIIKPKAYRSDSREANIAEIVTVPEALVNGKMVPRNQSFHVALSDVGTFEQQIRDKEKALGIRMQDGIEIQYDKGFLKSGKPEVLGALLLIVTGILLILTLPRSGKKAGQTATRKRSILSSPLDFMTRAKYIRADEELSKKITFKDVAGLEEAKIEIMEFVDFLKNPKKYQKLGGKMPRGALLTGPPGCGKTLLAKAVAAEADVPFLAMAGSQFVEMIGGLGASRMRDLFQEAKEKSPCVVFIDEIDSIGNKRTGAMVGAQESEHTLNQLLVELDGMGTKKDIICLAATNRAEDLDKALLRPGRFSRHINIGLPTEKDREEIFKVHLNNLKNLEDNLDELAAWLAKLSTGMSGADIANICNEAALHAAREKQKSIKRKDFEYAVERIILGAARKKSVMSKEEKQTVAYHESGHALVSWMMKSSNALLKLSVVERIGSSLGAAHYEVKEKFLKNNEELFEEMCVILGGRAAEMIVFNKLTTGAESDLEKVTELAYNQVQMYGMNQSVGLVSFPKPRSGAKPGYSQNLQSEMDHEVQKLIAEAYKTAEQVLRDNEENLHRLAKELMTKETLNYHDIVELIGPPEGAGLSEESAESQIKEKV